MIEEIFSPYSHTRGRQFSKTSISLNNLDYHTFTYNDHGIFLAFTECTFEELQLSNPEVLLKDFPHIEIIFYFCRIDQLNIQNLVSPNVSVHFEYCQIVGTINPAAGKVSLQNCFTRHLSVSSSASILYLNKLDNYKYLKKFLGISTYDSLEELIWAEDTLMLRDFTEISVRTEEEIIIRRRRHYDFFLRIELLGENYHPDWKAFYAKPRVSIFVSSDNNTTSGNLSVSGTTLKALAFQGPSSGHNRIMNCKINQISLGNFSSVVKTVFQNIHAGKWDFYRDSYQKTVFEIKNSVLDNVSFDNFHFNTYDTLVIHQTKINSAAFSSCYFPDSFTRFQPEDIAPEGNKYYKDQYEILLQLKKALDASGNFCESQKIYSATNDALLKMTSISSFDRFILKSNKLSNRHGLSIKWPLIWLFVFTIPLYVLYLLSVDKIGWRQEFDVRLIGYYFSFIDLTHRNDFLVEKEQLGSWSLFIDYINKIVVGYLIYQFIAAFRRYGKSH